MVDYSVRRACVSLLLALVVLSACGASAQSAGTADPSTATSSALTRNLETSAARCPISAAEISAATGYAFTANDPAMENYVNCGFSSSRISLNMKYNPTKSFEAAKKTLTEGIVEGTPMDGLVDGTCREVPVNGPGTYGMKCNARPSQMYSVASADLLFRVDDASSFRAFTGGKYRSDGTPEECFAVALAIYEALAS